MDEHRTYGDAVAEHVAGYLESQRVALLALAKAERAAAYPSPNIEGGAYSFVGSVVCIE